eukprot:scaffold126854_cov57-Phaeocystis_antarctica.AAC.2
MCEIRSPSTKPRESKARLPSLSAAMTGGVPVNTPMPLSGPIWMPCVTGDSGSPAGSSTNRATVAAA